jgi:SAM-dependent methyltransferase
MATKNYSLSQMDDFYDALGNGIVKSSGVMNYIQHLLVAKRCVAGSTVLDVCCGRALLVPLLKRFCPDIAQYVGVDISSENLLQATTVLRLGDNLPPTFPCVLIRGDVTALPIGAAHKFDVIAYTSSIEHLTRSAAIESLKQVVSLLSKDGRLFLSTPNTPITRGERLQYKVHVYEWDQQELQVAVEGIGLEVHEKIGLLPPEHSELESVLVHRFGNGALAMWREMADKVPAEFLDPVMASVTSVAAREILFSCQLRRSRD